MSSKTLKGFIDQQNRRGIGVTPELIEHYEDVRYDELPWWKKFFTSNPKEVRYERKMFFRHLMEYFKEQS